MRTKEEMDQEATTHFLWENAAPSNLPEFDENFCLFFSPTSYMLGDKHDYIPSSVILELEVSKFMKVYILLDYLLIGSFIAVKDLYVNEFILPLFLCWCFGFFFYLWWWVGVGGGFRRIRCFEQFVPSHRDQKPYAGIKIMDEQEHDAKSNESPNDQ